MENDKQSTLILLYPDAHDQLGFVLDCLERGGYNMCRARSLRFTLTTAREFFDRFLVKGKDISGEIRRLTSYDEVPSIGKLQQKILKKIRETLLTFQLHSTELLSF